ncbi:hypothetical protein IMAU80007_01505 [Lactiplantibacillus plantarum]|nr:hypothetical protein C1T23_00986 [Lactiplantibacillus plantarum]MCG0689682.1 hypothetical protein [Lactiplantibacillus plantarum]MCG0940844.1 hypothetical protein [Lactiplantibacillus plantarum]
MINTYDFKFKGKSNFLCSNFMATVYTIKAILQTALTCRREFF